MYEFHYLLLLLLSRMCKRVYPVSLLRLLLINNDSGRSQPRSATLLVGTKRLTKYVAFRLVSMQRSQHLPPPLGRRRSSKKIERIGTMAGSVHGTGGVYCIAWYIKWRPNSRCQYFSDFKPVKHCHARGGFVYAHWHLFFFFGFQRTWWIVGPSRNSLDFILTISRSGRKKKKANNNDCCTLFSMW